MLPIQRLPFPVLRISDDGVIAESNGALERELGLSRDALLDHRLDDVVDAASRPNAADLLTPASPEQRVLTLSFPQSERGRQRSFYVLRSGPERWLIGQPVEFDAQRDALSRARERAEVQADEYATVSQELRQANEQLAQRAQALRDATEAKARFLATMSHELRTPLNAVLGYAGLLRDGVYGAISEQQGRAVQSIVRRAKDLQLLIDDVLDLSKIEAGRMELRVDEFDPAAVLGEVKDTIASFARDKRLTVSVRTNVRHPVRADRAKYKQVVLNLASNAVKFTPEQGEVTLSVEELPDDRFRTCVSDTGIGIAPENLARIFENFQQVDSGTTRRFQGIGLGLSIVRRMVELLGGTIDVTSEPGHGTRFRIELPTRPHAEAMLGAVPVEVPSDSELSGEPIIVAIDDDPEVIGLLRDSLAPAHYRVVGALTGDRGIELARILQPFAITLDIMMPEKDGWQVLREIKADPELRGTPVIIMSIVAERTLGFSLGVTEYLVKPVDRRVLIDVLERLRHPSAARTAIVIDDDYDARTLLHDLLGSMGFTVQTCDSGRSCLPLLRDIVPDVLFLDVTMSEDDVSTVLDALGSDPRFARTRVVIVTRAESGIEHEDWLRRAAAAVVYHGHERPEALLQELRAALARIGTPITV